MKHRETPMDLVTTWGGEPDDPVKMLRHRAPPCVKDHWRRGEQLDLLLAALHAPPGGEA